MKNSKNDIVLNEDMPLPYDTNNIGALSLPKYKSILIIGNLRYMCTKSFTENQKVNWLENFGVENIDYKEEKNENC